MKTLNSIILLIFLGYFDLFSQVGINSGGVPPDPSAIMDINSTSKGFLLPRMTYDERNAIDNPAEGLIVFCTDCGLDATGTLCVFTGSDWYTFNLCKINAPDPDNNLAFPPTIIWKWNSVTDAAGYKWSNSNDLLSAIDMGSDTSKIESGITIDTLYTRYVWAYNDCGYSTPVSLTQSTADSWICGDTIAISHIVGEVAPVNKTVVYNTVCNIPGEPSKCWITSNLGADRQALSKNDATESSAGWYWQFNRLQGYKHDGTTRTPNNSWLVNINEASNWVAQNDPCTHELGNGWRIPTSTEWYNVDLVGIWVDWNSTWNSNLKLHAAGYIDASSGALTLRGTYGGYWSQIQHSNATSGYCLFFFSSGSSLSTYPKATGYTLRCIRD